MSERNMAKRREQKKRAGTEPTRAAVRWADGGCGEVVRAVLEGDMLRLELTRGEHAIEVTLTRLAPGFYAGPWVVTGPWPSHGSANATLIKASDGTVSVTVTWFDGAKVTSWSADGVENG